ncbi:MAG: pyrimidine/purine nucleoside phosphorylase [Desulfocapsaceae bacterium]|nr:pyrimidine/purine nucleoside phosphorylase [Desulfocapsaceae bacterium]
MTKKANVYFDGKVTSRTITFADGSRKTLGIMVPGDYRFNTDAAEVMEIIAGSLQVQLPGSELWQTFEDGSSFEVPAKSAFSLKVSRLTDYCCSYLK